MRVAWVTPYAPDRGGGGGQIRQAHLLDGIAGDHQVTVVCPDEPTDDAVLRALHDVVTVSPAGSTWLEGGRLARRAGDLAGMTGRGGGREERALRPLRAALAPALARLDPEVVLVEFAGLAPLIADPALTRLQQVPWLLTYHNLPSRMAAQLAAVAPHRRQAWLFRREATVAAAAERRAAGAYRRVIVTSDADRRCLPEGAAVDVVGNGVDLARFVPTALPDEARVLFSGALYTTPNTDGIAWFCHQVLPEVRRRCPGVRLDVVGARPTAEVQALARLPGVTVSGDVEDVRPHLQRCRVSIVPLRVGSGTRLKALEAWAAGRPVVGTSIGLEGLGAVDARHALVADTAADFAGAVATLLDGEEPARRLAAAGRALVEAEHGWAGAAARFRAVLESAHR